MVLHLLWNGTIFIAMNSQLFFDPLMFSRNSLFVPYDVTPRFTQTLSCLTQWKIRFLCFIILGVNGASKRFFFAAIKPSATVLWTHQKCSRTIRFCFQFSASLSSLTTAWKNKSKNNLIQFMILTKWKKLEVKIGNEKKIVVCITRPFKAPQFDGRATRSCLGC